MRDNFFLDFSILVGVKLEGKFVPKVSGGSRVIRCSTGKLVDLTHR